MIPVVWLDQRMMCWDQAILDDLFTGRWPTGYQFEHHEGLDGLDGAVVVVAGQYHVDEAPRIQERLAALDWVLLVVVSDEAALFPAIQHPNMAVWRQTPKAADADGYLPVGYPPHLHDHLARCVNEREWNWSFAGQVNHRRRKACVDILRSLDGGVLIETPGFTQGLEHGEYAALLAQTKVVPCPGGPRTPDTFRLVEALEAGCIPVADAATPQGEMAWYWPLVFGEPPFPVIKDWAEFPGLLQELLAVWPANANRVSAWWQDWKRQLAHRFADTITRLSRVVPDPPPVTVLIPTSPIVAHPDTSVIEQTVASVRHWLPDAEILIMCDGVRPEQEHYRDAYEQYLNRLLWLTGTKWDRVLPIVHDEHLHQAEMTKKALDMVRTPLVLFVEHDTPIVTDEPIDWPALTEACLSGDADLIRLHHEALVLPDHEHLMLDQKSREVSGAPLLRTVQWSQRPHLAATGFYRRILANDFPDGYVGMIEDRMHSVVHSAWRDYGLAGWDRYRLWMYSPSGSIKRSYHLDGRGTDEKWVDS